MELLVVIVIVAVLAGFAAPAVNSVLRGSQMTQASQSVNDALNLARQSAITLNRPVELRFFKFIDQSAPGQTVAVVQAFQLFELRDDGLFVPRGKLVRLPPSVIVDSGSDLSTIFEDGNGSSRLQTGTDAAMQRLLRSKGSYEFVGIRFRTDGGTDLDYSKQWFLTLHDARPGDGVQDVKAVPNFVTFQVDPVSGIARSFRPS
jgi:uncharacterized protein (TIGR02596 family)